MSISWVKYSCSGIEPRKPRNFCPPKITRYTVFAVAVRGFLLWRSVRMAYRTVGFLYYRKTGGCALACDKNIAVLELKHMTGFNY